MEFYMACEEGDLSKVKQLSTEVDVGFVPDKRSGYNGLMIACWEKKDEIVLYLMTLKEVEVNTKDTLGRTAFWIACLVGHNETVRVMLAGHKKIDTTAMAGERNCLDIAKWRGFSYVSDLVYDYIKNPDYISTSLRSDECFKPIPKHR
jgi:ankyrin repeat protein